MEENNEKDYPYHNMNNIDKNDNKLNEENNQQNFHSLEELEEDKIELKKKLSASSEDSGSLNENDLREINLSHGVRDATMILFLIANILISFDHGSIPASTNPLRQFTENDTTIGLFGSLVYVGNIIGSIFIFKLINIYSRKYLLILSLCSNAILLYTFIYFNKLIFLFTNRVLVGIFQAYITIYLPVWCNQYGEKNNRTFMIGLYQLASPVGIFFGYTVAAIAIEKNVYGGWKFAFVVQSILILILTVTFLLIPGDYFSKNIYSLTDHFGIEKFVVGKKYFQSKTKEEDIPINKMIKIILKKPIFVFSVLGLSCLIYVITGIQYWISDYLMNVLGVISGKTRLFYFTIVCFTSPTLGVLLGIITKNKFCKTDMLKSLYFCAILGVFAAGFAIVVPLCYSILLFVIFVWIVLFFGGGIVPVITNIIITAVPKKLDASGNSITNFCCNLFGYLPAPYVYGILSDIFYDKGVIGMRVTMWYSAVGIIFLLIATYFGYQNEQKKKFKKKSLSNLDSGEESNEHSNEFEIKFN